MCQIVVNDFSPIIFYSLKNNNNDLKWKVIKYYTFNAQHSIIIYIKNKNKTFFKWEIMNFN